MSPQPIAIVPARAGSTRLPGKNTKDFLGRPIIEYTLAAALESGVFSEVVVSSDDPRALDIAARMGCTPQPRPAELADGETILATVAEYVLAQPPYREVDHFCLLLPACPLRSADDIRDSYRLMTETGAASVIAVTAMGVDFFHSFWRVPSGEWRRVFEDRELKSSQHYPKVFGDTGAIYWGRVESLLREKAIYCQPLELFEVPYWKAVDIDTADDWELAEIFYRHKVLGTDNRAG